MKIQALKSPSFLPLGLTINFTPHFHITMTEPSSKPPYICKSESSSGLTTTLLTRDISNLKRFTCSQMEKLQVLNPLMSVTLLKRCPSQLLRCASAIPQQRLIWNIVLQSSFSFMPGCFKQTGFESCKVDSFPLPLPHFVYLIHFSFRRGKGCSLIASGITTPCRWSRLGLGRTQDD